MSWIFLNPRGSSPLDTTTALSAIAAPGVQAGRTQRLGGNGIVGWAGHARVEGFGLVVDREPDTESDKRATTRSRTHMLQ